MFTVCKVPMFENINRKVDQGLYLFYFESALWLGGVNFRFIYSIFIFLFS